MNWRSRFGRARKRLKLRIWVAPGMRLFGATRGIPRAQAGARPDRNQPSIPSELIQLAWPICAAMLGETFMGLVDTKLVGALGAAALGGVGVATTLMFLNYAVVFGLMRGVKVRTAHAVGRGSPQDGVRYAQAGVLMGALAGAVAFWVGRDVSWALSLLRIDPELVPHAKSFFAAITCGAPATCMLAALIQHRQGVGDTRSPMVVGIAGNLVNAVLSYGLIYGHFGLPALGVRGAGFGTATTEWLELLVLLAQLRSDVRQAGTSKVSVGTALRAVAELGVPTGLQFGLETVAFASLSAILGSIGSAEIAAHQVALATIRTSFLPGIAVGEAASVLVGRSLGRRRLAEADQATYAALAVAGTFMAMCGVVFAVLGGTIARAFTDDAHVALIAQRLLWVAAAFQVLDAFNVVLRGALRGAKDVRVAAYIGIAAVWTCVPTAAFFLGKLAGWGAVGGWCGFLGETMVSSTLFWQRWRRGAWRNEYAPSSSACAQGELLAGPVVAP
jgi:MATE family multidrug resistance protein